MGGGVALWPVCGAESVGRRTEQVLLPPFLFFSFLVLGLPLPLPLPLPLHPICFVSFFLFLCNYAGCRLQLDRMGSTCILLLVVIYDDDEGASIHHAEQSNAYTNRKGPHLISSLPSLSLSGSVHLSPFIPSL